MIRLKKFNILKVFAIGSVPIAESLRHISITYEEIEVQLR